MNKWIKVCSAVALSGVWSAGTLSAYGQTPNPLLGKWRVSGASGPRCASRSSEATMEFGSVRAVFRDKYSDPVTIGPVKYVSSAQGVSVTVPSDPQFETIIAHVANGRLTIGSGSDPSNPDNDCVYERM